MRVLRPSIIGLIGTLAWAPGQAADLCVGPWADGTNGTVDCDTAGPVILPHAWFGFSDASEDACSTCEKPVGESLCQQRYTWSISASSTDPFLNVAPLPADGWLNIWLVENRFDQACTVGFAFEGSLAVQTIEPLGGVVWADWLFPEVALSLPSIDAPYLIARILVENPVATRPPTWGQIKARYH